MGPNCQCSTVFKIGKAHEDNDCKNIYGKGTQKLRYGDGKVIESEMPR